MALHRQALGLLKKCCLQNTLIINPTDVRCIKRWVSPTLRELHRRKEKAGEQPERPRSAHLEWNYNAEVYAFGKRLGEEFQENILKKALTHKSYVNMLEIQQEKEEIPALDISHEENTELIQRGEEIISKYINLTFEKKYPKLVVKILHDYLTTETMLAHVGSHIGLKDIILTSEFPVEQSTIAGTFKAVVAALEDSASLERSQTFVKDMLLSQLNGVDVFDIWEPKEAYVHLQGLVGDKKLEPRLCNQSAMNTILANYQVGIYSDKKLIGIGWGESVDIAKNTAALNAIQKIYHI